MTPMPPTPNSRHFDGHYAAITPLFAIDTPAADTPPALISPLIIDAATPLLFREMPCWHAAAEFSPPPLFSPPLMLMPLAFHAD